ncbi:small ribosomal subunit protein uS11m [Stigmatopora argus]
MFKLTCSALNSLNGACRKAAANGITLSSRAFQSAPVRLQETTTTSKESADSRDFSHFPPMPGLDSPLRWAGKKFEELHVLHIKATYNNTHIQLTDSEGQSLVRASCGTEGFKGSKRSTAVAAQAAAIAAAAKATAKGVTFVRVLVKGLGPGRLSAIKGLTMGGLEVVSISDNTPVPHNGCRPRKARRL